MRFRIANINVDFIRVSTAINRPREDVVKEEVGTRSVSMVGHVYKHVELTTVYFLDSQSLHSLRLQHHCGR